MQMAYDEVNVKYKRKFEEFLELEKSNQLVVSENEIVKREVVALTRTCREQADQIANLSQSNESLSKRFNDLQASSET